MDDLNNEFYKVSEGRYVFDEDEKRIIELKAGLKNIDRIPPRVDDIILTLDKQIEAMTDERDRDRLQTLISDALPAAIYLVCQSKNVALDKESAQDVITLQDRLKDRLAARYEKMLNVIDPGLARLERSLPLLQGVLNTLNPTDKMSFLTVFADIEISTDRGFVVQRKEDAKVILESFKSRTDTRTFAFLNDVIEDLAISSLKRISDKVPTPLRPVPEEQLTPELKNSMFEEALRNLLDDLRYHVGDLQFFSKSTELLMILSANSRNFFRLQHARLAAEQWWQNYLGRNSKEKNGKIGDTRIDTEAGSYPIACSPRNVEAYVKHSAEAKVAAQTDAMLRQKIDEIKTLFPEEVSSLVSEYQDRILGARNESEIMNIYREMARSLPQNILDETKFRLLTVIDEQYLRRDRYDLLPFLAIADEQELDKMLKKVVLSHLSNRSPLIEVNLYFSAETQQKMYAYNFRNDRNSQTDLPSRAAVYDGNNRILNVYVNNDPSINDIYRSPFAQVGNSEMAVTLNTNTGHTITKLRHRYYDAQPMQRPVLRAAARAVDLLDSYSGNTGISLPHTEKTELQKGYPQLEAIQIIKLPKDNRKVTGMANELPYRFTPTNLLNMAILDSLEFSGQPSGNFFNDYQELVAPKKPLWKPRNPFNSALQSLVIHFPEVLREESSVISTTKYLNPQKYKEDLKKYKEWAKKLTIKKYWTEYGLGDAAIISAPLGKLTTPIGPIANATDRRIDRLRHVTVMFSPIPQVELDDELRKILQNVKSEFFATARSDSTTAEDLNRPRGGVIGYTSDPDTFIFKQVSLSDGTFQTVPEKIPGEDIITVKVEIGDVVDVALDVATNQLFPNVNKKKVGASRQQAPYLQTMKDFVKEWQNLTRGKITMDHFINARDKAFDKFCELRGEGILRLDDYQINTAEEFMEFCNKEILQRGAYFRLNEVKLKNTRKNLPARFAQYGGIVT